MPAELTDREYDLADAIEAVMAEHEAGRLWLASELARKLKGFEDQADRIYPVLVWMEEHQFMTTNGRGGCWRRFTSTTYRPEFADREPQA